MSFRFSGCGGSHAPPARSRAEDRGPEEDRDSKRVRRSGFDASGGDGGVQLGGGYAQDPYTHQDAGAQPQAVGMAESEFAKAVREAAARAASMAAAGEFPAHSACAPRAYSHLAGPGGGVPGYPSAPGYGGGYAPPAPQSYGGTPAPGYGAPAVLGASVQEIVMAHADACGKIIGRGGETISQLQAQTGANIKVQPSGEVTMGQPRRVTITGAPANVAAAKRLVEDFLAEPAPLSLGLIGGGYTGPPAPGTLQPIAAPMGYMPSPMPGRGDDGPGVAVPIPADMVGRIIGRGGETIRRLQDESGARIQIERDQGQVRIKGTNQAVETARRLVQEVISAPPQGSSGGMGGGAMGGGMGGGGGQASAVVQTLGQEGRIIGRGGETIRELQQRTGCRVQIDRGAGIVNVSGPDQRMVDEAVRQINELVSTGQQQRGGGGMGGGMGGGYQPPAAGGYQQAPVYGGGYQAQPQYGEQAQGAVYGGGYAAQQYLAPSAAAFTGGAPVASVWIPQTTPEGHTYWYSTSTGESVWEKPADA